MDPLTQGALGALAAQTAAGKAQLGKAAVIGGLAAMTPDLDVLIQSSADPLLALEYHRHFTHSLFFIPLGGPLAGLILYVLLGRRWGLPLNLVLVFSTLGFATHGLLDLCTSYGTSLLWPVSDARLSLDLVSIIDPLASGPMALALLLAGWRRQRRFAWLGLAWLLAYLLLGGWQQLRAEHHVRELAVQRGHEPQHLRAMPSLGNLLVWRTVYAAQGEFHIDAVGVGPAGIRHFPGAPVQIADLRLSWPLLPAGSQQLRDAQRFAHFSQGYIGFVPQSDMTRIGDVRYSVLPNGVEPLWGIRLDQAAGAGPQDTPPEPDDHPAVFMPGQRGIVSLKTLWSMIRQTLNTE